MSLRFFVLLLFLAVGWCAQVQAGSVKTPVPDEDIVLLDQAQAQKRRDTLRETLKVPVQENNASDRQLSAQQKAELRQQVRQQRSDSHK